MRRMIFLWVGIAFATTTLQASAMAQEQKCDRKSDRETCGRANNDGFDFEANQRIGSTRADDGLSSVVSRPESPLRTETVYAPTCTGNGPGASDVLCNEAITACPVPSEVRFWVYTRQVDTRIPGDDPPFERVSNPPYICRDLTAPEIDPAVAIAGIVNRDFQRVVALKGVPEISPEPDTLVNIDTIFTTSSPNSYDIPLTVLGRSVVITATASRWTWHFGDGATGSTAEAGSKGRVLHTYRQSGSRGAYVVIEWTGTFRVGGGPVQPVTGTATTTGDPVTVSVKQARTELVGG